MVTITYIDEMHKSFLLDKLNFYQIDNYEVVNIDIVNKSSTLIVKTNFNLDKSILDGVLPIDANIIKILKTKPFIKVVFF